MNARARRATGLGRWTGAALDQEKMRVVRGIVMCWGVAKSGLAAERKGAVSPRGGRKWIVGAKATEIIVLSTLRPLLRSAGLMVKLGPWTLGPNCQEWKRPWVRAEGSSPMLNDV